MGMFDYLRCELQLPAPDAEGLEFQTKDTPAQWMDLYAIRADGSLWHEAYDTEDRSDPNAEGLMRLSGAMTRVNTRWEPCSEWTGEIRFYKYFDKTEAWLEFSAYFERGQLVRLNLVEDTRASKVASVAPADSARGGAA